VSWRQNILSNSQHRFLFIKEHLGTLFGQKNHFFTGKKLKELGKRFLKRGRKKLVKRSFPFSLSPAQKKQDDIYFVVVFSLQKG
jgi:hypothetical protein